METVIKVKIVKSVDGNTARRLVVTKDTGAVIGGEPMEMPEATQLIKKLNLSQESKEKLNGNTVYIYA
jgi:hypothetical protein